MAVQTMHPSGAVKRVLVGLVFGGALFLSYSHNAPSGYDFGIKASDITGLLQSVRDFGTRIWTDAPRLGRGSIEVVPVARTVTVPVAWNQRPPEWTLGEGEPPRDDVSVPALNLPVETPKGGAKAAITMLRPVEGPLAAGFGIRNHPIGKSVKLHKGIDIAGKEGDPVLAALPGVVDFAGGAGTLGNAVIMRHDDGRVTKYGHMSKVMVRSGQRLAAGDRVGSVGHTGEATGPHLHFELLVDGSPVDPLSYFPASRNGM